MFSKEYRFFEESVDKRPLMATDNVPDLKKV